MKLGSFKLLPGIHLGTKRAVTKWRQLNKRVHHNAIHEIPKVIISSSLSRLGASLHFRERQTIVAEMCEFILQHYFNMSIQFIVSYKLRIEICSSLWLRFEFHSALFVYQQQISVINYSLRPLGILVTV